MCLPRYELMDGFSPTPVLTDLIAMRCLARRWTDFRPEGQGEAIWFSWIPHALGPLQHGASTMQRRDTRKSFPAFGNLCWFFTTAFARRVLEEQAERVT